jgi:hypothetical protein
LKKPLETKDPSKMTIAKMSALFDKGIELPTMNVVKNYIRDGVLVEDLLEWRTVR